MKKITAFILMSFTLASSTEALTPRLANAQLFYPPASDRNSLMVIGQGVVKVPADTADIELVISAASNNNEFESQPSSLSISLPLSSTNVLLNQQKPTAPVSPKLSLASQTALNQATLKPIVDSLVAKGIRANNIKVQPSENQAKILVRLEKPTSDRVKEIRFFGYFYGDYEN
ncbi:MAG: hypothetical protein MET45_24680 [Nostoc sp. LLA-1]|nr:hypothetical protein [Cyanocohniella sp. LLY]